MLSQEEYVGMGGDYCPNCESEEIEDGSIDAEFGEARQEVVCNECGFTWTDVYRLVGYEGRG